MTIREATVQDRPEWLRMRVALWPGSPSEHDIETQRYFEQKSGSLRTFVAEGEGRLVGFLELDQRKYAPGCSSSPVPFIEGWYVEPDMRRRGIGRALVVAAEDWAGAAGFTEIASDAEIENDGSLAAHAALGYTEIERVVCLRRAL